MQGHMKHPKPTNLQLYRTDLPWVKTATHLGHELHQASTMDQDAKVKRARFIGDSTEVRETFNFAEPQQILQAVRLYCGHFYGSMLWDLNSEMCGQFCRSWNTCVKLAYNIPRSTHTYLVEHCLAAGFVPVRTEMMARYVKFHQNLLQSKSFEVQVLVNLVSKDIRSTTAKNIALIEKEAGKTANNLSPQQVRELIVKPPVPMNQEWRMPLLQKLYWCH